MLAQHEFCAAPVLQFCVDMCYTVLKCGSDPLRVSEPLRRSVTSRTRLRSNGGGERRVGSGAVLCRIGATQTPVDVLTVVQMQQKPVDLLTLVPDSDVEVRPSACRLGPTVRECALMSLSRVLSAD